MLLHLGIYRVDHHSTAFLLLGGVIGLITLGGIAFDVWALRLSPEQVDNLRRRTARGRDLYLLIALAILLLFGVGMRDEWFYTHVAVMLSSGAALGYHLLYADAPPLSRRWIGVIVLGVIAVVILRLNALSYYPYHFEDDEPWDLGWALSYLQHGYFTDTIMYYGGSDIQRFMLPVAWWISLFGPGYWQTRLFFFLLIFPLIGLTGLAARNLYRNSWIVALIMFSSVVVMGAARIRHDIGLALAVAASLWLYTEANQRQRGWLHFAAGLAIGLGWFAHYHAIGFGVAMALAFYLPGYLTRLRNGRRLPELGFWWFVLGGLLGALIVFLLQVLPSWESFIAVRVPRTPQTLSQLIDVYFAQWGRLIRQSRLEFVLVMAAMAAALWRHRRNDILLVLTILLMHAALTLQTYMDLDYYLLPIAPIYAILIAALFTEGIGAPIKRSVAVAAAALVLIVNLGFTLQTPVRHLTDGQSLQLPVPPVATWVREHIDPSKSIVTQHWYYLFLTDYRFISPLTYLYAPRSIRESETPEQMWAAIDPDVVIIDRNSGTCCIPPILTETYLDAHGYQLTDELPGERVPVLVYQKPDGE